MHVKSLLNHLQPTLYPDSYVFTLLDPEKEEVTQEAFAQIREKEGLTLILPQRVADQYGLTYEFVAARITLQVHSDLAAVGLTAEVSWVLAEAKISCNVVAGYYHDHLFVPYNQREEALACLLRLTKTES